MGRLAAVVLLLLAGAVPAAAQPTVFLVRHAERADGGAGPGKMMASEADPDLSGAGKQRADALARMLKDSKIAGIFTTDFKRTRQTAAPLATALGLTPTVVSSKDLPGLLQKIKTATGHVLVVAHSNTIPEILKALHVPDPVTVGEQEFDNLFVIVRGTLVRLRY
jgi:broad specificity phosphatase PhoE